MSRQNREFAEILEAEIKKNSSTKSQHDSLNTSDSKNIHSQSTFSFEQFHLNLKIKPAVTLDLKPAFQKSPYILYIKSKPQTRVNHVLSELQKAAFDFLKTYDSHLSQAFNQQELKRAFRTSVLKTHPDHQGSTELFLKTQHAYKTLKSVLL